MTLNFDCPKCGAEIEVDASLRGQPIACPECSANIEVPPAMLLPGQEVAGYRVRKLLGVGNMGQVYLAMQMTMDRPVALKVLPPDVLGSAAELASFQREVRLLARVEHPNVVTAIEAGADGGVHFLAMQYVKGETLDTRQEREGRLPEKDVLIIGLRLAEALSYAWDKHHILHRDVKPGNIMVDDGGNVKLMDMGISLVRGERGSPDASGMVVGTPYYMSPEQTLGRAELDFRADLYALGATMFHLVTGTVPYDSPVVPDILRQHREASVPSARQRCPAVSRECDALLERMMAKDPAERHASWQALVKDLRFMLKGGPTELEAPGAKTQHGAARRTLVMSPTAAGAVVAARSAAAAGKPGRYRTLLVVMGGLVLLGAVGAGVAVHLLKQTVPAPPPVGEPPETIPTLPGPTISPPPTKPPPDGTKLPVPADPERDRRAQQEKTLLEVMQAYRDQPEKAAELAKRLQALAAEVRDPTLATAVRQALTTLEAGRQQSAMAVMDELTKQAAAREARGDLAGALALFEQYQGKLAAETAAMRATQATAVRQRARQVRQAQYGAALAFASLREQVASALLAQEYKAATEVIAAARAEPAPFAPPERAAFLDLANAVANLPQRLLDAFRAEAGKETSITLKDERKLTVEIVGVVGEVVEAFEITAVGAGKGKVRRNFTLAELSAADRARRLGDDRAESTLAMKGLLAVAAGKPDAAVRNFEAVGAGLGEALLYLVRHGQPEALNTAAVAAWAALLKTAGIENPEPPAPVLLDQVWKLALTPEQKLAVRIGASLYARRYGNCPQFARVRQVYEALGSVASDVDTGERDAQLKDLGAAIERLNPGWTRTAMKAVAGSDGISLELGGAAALRALPPFTGLPVVSLKAVGTGLTELPALRGVALRDLDVARTEVATLEGLRGLPLRALNLAFTRVSSVSALANLPLEVLDLSGTPVSDLRPLRGMPLRELYLAQMTELKDLAPLGDLPTLEKVCVPRGLDLAVLEGLKDLKGLGYERDKLVTASAFLKEYQQARDAERTRKVRGLIDQALIRLIEDNPALSARRQPFQPGITITDKRVGLTITNANEVSEIRALEGLPLTELNLNYTRVMNLAPLKGMPLTHLMLISTPVTDLSPLRGMKLVHLDLRGAPVGGSLEVLRGMPLSFLGVSGRGIKDLQDLRELRPETLYLDSTSITDYRHLQGMPIKTLSLNGNDLDDVRDLKDLPLVSLSLRSTKVKDLDVLGAIPLESLNLTGTPIKSFNFVRRFPLKEFQAENTAFNNLTLFKGKPLERLVINSTPTKSLASIEGLPLRWLEFANTDVYDLAPLAGMQLERLNAATTLIRSLEPLRGMPLRHLRLDGCKRLADFSVLRTFKTLESLTVPEDTKGLEFLRELPNLRYLGTAATPNGVITPAAEFWEQYETGRKH